MIYDSLIRKENGYDPHSCTYYPVVIIGAGESGIAMGCRLKEVLGFDQFRLFDRQAGIGGTWWINRYPGVACDIPAAFYSFSFCPNPNWTAAYPAGPEVVAYLQDVCEKYKIMDKIELNTEVIKCRWDESSEVWEVVLQHLTVGSGDLSVPDRQSRAESDGRASVYLQEETIRCKVLVSAVGALVEPKPWPDAISGKDQFKGDIFHSARWRYDVDLKEKDVIVIGSGCSAAQFVPRLIKDYGAKSVTQLMRTPPWIVPRQGAASSDHWDWTPWLNTYVPLYQKSIRYLIAAVLEYDWRFFGGSEYSAKERKKMETKLLSHLHKVAPSKYHEMLTPNYGIGCKRRVSDNEWLQCLHDPKIELMTNPLISIGENSVNLGSQPVYPPNANVSNAASGEFSKPADVIILANGFDTYLKWLHPIEVIGKAGKGLQEVFDERGGPQMYWGTAMDGFPNFFCLFGPNTATGHSSVILATENAVSMSLEFIRPVLKGEVAQVEVKKEAEMKYTADIQDAFKRSIWTIGGCTSWYKTDGWNSTVYPYSQIWFTLRCMFPKWSDWDTTYTAKGLRKRRIALALRTCVFILAVAGILRGKKAGYSAHNIPKAARSVVGLALAYGANSLNSISQKLVG